MFFTICPFLARFVAEDVAAAADMASCWASWCLAALNRLLCGGDKGDVGVAAPAVGGKTPLRSYSIEETACSENMQENKST